MKPCFRCINSHFLNSEILSKRESLEMQPVYHVLHLNGVTCESGTLTLICDIMNLSKKKKLAHSSMVEQPAYNRQIQVQFPMSLPKII